MRLPTPDDTRAFGAMFATLLLPGDLVVLTGPLGAGKTVVAQGIAAGLGISDPIVSPTFVLARVYRGGRLPLVHVDAYRMSSISEVDDLDLDTDLPESVVLVEWGHGLVEQLSEDHVEIRLTREADSEVRDVEVATSSQTWRSRLASLSFSASKF